MSGVRVGIWRQARLLARVPDYASFIAMSPLSTIMFVAIMRSAGRDDLGINAVIGVSLITCWQTGLFIAGDTLAVDRQFGVFELNLAAPVSIERVVFGRVVVSTTYSFIPFGASVVTARLVFGSDVVDVANPARMLLVTIFTWFAALGAFLCMSSIFVLSGRSTALSNGLSYPLFLVAGVVVPVAFLPGSIQTISSVVFMSWAADGMRTTANGTEDSIADNLAMLTALGTVMLVLGVVLLRLVIDRMRWTGQVTAS